ncbi:hypothetical protein [Komagataeibacter rhaeticus]|uniref:hypothetical protein n=1 Tax=Komagataeibacter rhaeticus TaxID=215221 RepID=UPI0012EB5FD4|nr:hypothetical protein [Komagataeibacter rhaeticus]
MPHIEISQFFRDDNVSIVDIRQDLLAMQDNLDMGTKIKMCSALCIEKFMIKNNFECSKSSYIDGFFRKMAYIGYCYLSYCTARFRAKNAHTTALNRKTLENRLRRAQNFEKTWTKKVEGSKNRWLMRLARDFRVLAI